MSNSNPKLQHEADLGDLLEAARSGDQAAYATLLDMYHFAFEIEKARYV